MIIRSATAAEIPAIIRLERACPTAAHWTEAQYQRAVGPGSGDPERLVLVAEALQPSAKAVGDTHSGSPVLGFLVARHLAPEWELENIVVATTARRKGVGRQLVDALLARTREPGSESVFLEVRESNTAARKFYEQAEFQQTGRRKSYYADPLEDAIVYRRGLTEAFSE